MATSLTIPATAYRPARPKSYHELVETSSTVFDTSLDDQDRERPFNVGSPKPQPEVSPAHLRELAALRAADRILRFRRGDHFALMREHLVAMDLTVAKLAHLDSSARFWTNSKSAREKGWSGERWNAAARLMHRAALSILLDVPAHTWRDAGELATLASTTLDPLPKAQQRKVAKRLARYFAAMLAGSDRLDGAPQYVTTIQGDGMAPAFSEGDQVVYERHRGKPIPGAYYIIAWRSRDGSKYDVVRRLSHVTPTGRWAVELFNGTDGKPRLDYFSPKHWRLAYRIVRHYSRKH